ncbi:hypothetical protein HK096_000852 [Nowakowskiella sp. JEL0078]|nr:hypothetical protein HK096_000852 [Nowakowskiella sp. JEL0078]
MRESFDLIEKNLKLLGATAIEDKLQENVPECISILRKAGINIWVLTGDKLETSINVGFLSNILTSEMNLLILKLNDMENLQENEDNNKSEIEIIHQQMKDALDNFFPETNSVYTNSSQNQFKDENENKSKQSNPNFLANILSFPSLKIVPRLGGFLRIFKSKHNLMMKKDSSFALIIDGRALSVIFENLPLQKTFLDLSIKCKSVICCRVSPKQKAQIVRLVKNDLDAMCLSIGDGANDVG